LTICHAFLLGAAEYTQTKASRTDVFTQLLNFIKDYVMKNRTRIGLSASLLFVVLLSATLSGCGDSAAESPSSETASTAGGISPKAFSDAVHAVMMADRTVYATHVVTRLKKQEAPVKPSEYWQDEDHTLPLPAQMFRMGAEIVNENPKAGFTYSLTSQWPLNPQHQAKGVEIEGLKFLEENPDENFYAEEEIAGKKYFTALYSDKAVAEACWTCHNEHANKGDDYPTFGKDDVMGGVVVRVPID